MIKASLIVSIFAACLAGCAGSPKENASVDHQAPPINPQPSAASQPISQPNEVERIIANLGSDSYAARQAAMEDMRALLIRRTQETAHLQESLQTLQLSLARQLESLTYTSDPESQARVAGLFEFQYGLTGWLLDIHSLPNDQRKVMTQWGFEPDNIKLVAGAYGRKTQSRVSAAKALAKISGPQADWLLSQLVGDSETEVALATLDAIWDRPLADPVLDALWTRATAASNQQLRVRSNNARSFTVRGRAIQIYDQQYRSQEIDLIVDMLIQSKDTRVTDRLNRFFEDVMANLREPQDYRWRMISSNFGDSGRVMMRLTEAFKPAKALTFLIKAIGNNSSDGYNTTLTNVQYRSSSRIEASAVLLRMTNQNTEDYGIVKHPNMGNRYLLKGTEKEEEALIKKIQEWWKENEKKF